MLIGQRMTVWTADGPVFGVIARKPIHLLTEDERKQVPKMKDLWLDIGAANKEEAGKTVRIGDAVTVELGFHTAAEQLRRLARHGRQGRLLGRDRGPAPGVPSGKLTCGLYAVSTVQEEIGLRGAKTSAFGIDPQVGVAVDVTHATDCPTIEKKEEGDVRLGKGPVIHRGPNMNHKVVERLIQAADDNQIAYQLAASARPPAPTPTPSRSTAPAWPRAWSAFRTATCTVRSR